MFLSFQSNGVESRPWCLGIGIRGWLRPEVDHSGFGMYQDRLYTMRHHLDRI